MDYTDIQKDISLPERPQAQKIFHPKKFVLWLFIVSIVMIFAALTSAYIVRQAEGNWLEFNLPDLFWVSSGIILLSSLFAQYAYISGKKEKYKTVNFALILTLALGLSFLALQYLAWGKLVASGVFFTGASSNPSGSFLYILTALHALHLVSGIIFLLIVLIASLRGRIKKKQLVRLEMCVTYWHFLGGLWIYLFFFLWWNR